MKKLLMNTTLLMFVLLFCSTNSVFSQTNDQLIANIDAVLASPKIPAIKKAMAKAFVTQLTNQYIARIDANGEAIAFQTAEKQAVLDMITAYNATIAAIVVAPPPAGGAAALVTPTPPPVSPAKAIFVEVPQAGNTSVTATGDAGKEYQFSVDGNDAGKATAIDGGLIQKTVPELVSGSRVVIRPVQTDGKTDDSKGVSENVVSYIDPTKGGMFGVLVGGAVYSQQNNNFSSTSPFFGFNAGYGTDVKNANRYIADVLVAGVVPVAPAVSKKVVLIASSDKDSLSDTYGRIWTRNFAKPDKLSYINGVNEVLIPNTAEWQKTGSNGQPVRLKTSCYFCSYRVGFRVQGIFEADARAATAETGATPTTSTANDFTFLTSQQTFTASTEAWLEFSPLRQFSFGPYASVGASSLINREEKVGDKIVDDKGNASVITKFDNDLKNFYEVGGIFNLKFADQKFFMQSILAYGKHEAYKDLDQNLKSVTGFKINDTRNRFIAKIRMFPEGLNTTFGRQINLTPMFGVDLNSGTGQDNLRFFTGFTIRLKGIGVGK
jgi:hypothetical protein